MPGYLLRTLFALATIIVSQLAAAQQNQSSLVIDDAVLTKDVAPHAWVLEDSSGGLEIDHVLKAYQQGEFSPAESGLEFGFSASIFWVRFQVTNSLPYTANLVFDEIGRAHV